MYRKSPSSKAARYFSKILHHIIENNISFQMNLVSRLAAADCASGISGNIDISKHTCTIIYHQQDPDNMDVSEVSFLKSGSLFFKNTSTYDRRQYFLSNESSHPFGCSSLCVWQPYKLQLSETLWNCNITARYLCLIFRQQMQEKITFKMNLVSHLAAADCASGIAGNIDISKQTCTIIYHQQDPDNMDVLEVSFLKNGSLFFKNTSPHDRREYFLSNESSQPFGRSSLCVWQSYKLQLSKTLWN